MHGSKDTWEQLKCFPVVDHDPPMSHTWSASDVERPAVHLSCSQAGSNVFAERPEVGVFWLFHQTGPPQGASRSEKYSFWFWTYCLHHSPSLLCIPDNETMWEHNNSTGMDVSPYLQYTSNLTRICAAEMAVRYAALSACRKVHPWR